MNLFRLLWLLLLGGCFYVTPGEHAARWDVDGDGVDRPTDCDDDDKAVQKRTFYIDGDGDGYGDPEDSVQGCEPPEGAVDNAEDCDDGEPLINPGVAEQCNGVDDDCNGAVDDGDDLVPTWYLDDDGDGFGDPNAPVSACTQPEGTAANADDCAPFDNAAVHPGADEICNGIDDDCDGATDDMDDDVIGNLTWYFDGDGDSFGSGVPLVDTCFPPSDYVALGSGENEDCNDGDPLVNPDAIELCDGIDNNCNGTTDSDAVVPEAGEWFLDTDDDGYGLVSDVEVRCTCDRLLDGCERVLGPTLNDCDDSDPVVYPTAVEYCDGKDNDCNVTIDDVPCVPLAIDTGDTAP